MKILFLIAPLILSGSLSQICLAADVGKGSDSHSPLAVLSGDNSHVSVLTYRRIASETEWKRVWLKHLGLQEDTIYRPTMEVDFSRCIVIAILGGRSVNCCGYKIDSVRDHKDAVVVRFDEVSFQTAGPDGGAQHVTPYAFIVIPKTDKPVVLQENKSQNMSRTPAVWEEAARLNGMPAAATAK